MVVINLIACPFPLTGDEADGTACSGEVLDPWEHERFHRGMIAGAFGRLLERKKRCTQRRSSHSPAADQRLISGCNHMTRLSDAFPPRRPPASVLPLHSAS